MPTQEKIQSDFKTAFKGKDRTRLGTLKLLQAEIKNAELGKRAKTGKAETLTDDEVVAVVAREVKKRRDAISLYEKAGRTELSRREKDEEKILLSYLPEQMEEAEIRKLAEEIATKLGARDIKDLGRVMAEVSPKTKGRASGSIVSGIVREILSKDSA